MESKFVKIFKLPIKNIILSVKFHIIDGYFTQILSLTDMDRLHLLVKNLNNHLFYVDSRKYC